MEKSKRVAFLLGSGVSIAAGLPATSAITERVLSGGSIQRCSDKHYYLGSLQTGLGLDGFVDRVLRLLQVLKHEIDWYYRNESGRVANYEDLYYVSSQIHDSLMGEQDNPTVEPFVHKVSSIVAPWLVGQAEESGSEWTLDDLVTEAMNYIRDVVYHLLSKPPIGFDSLKCVVEACQDENVGSVLIFSLNHDTLLEQCLSAIDISVADGFGSPINGVRYWDPMVFERRVSKVRLYKLHGSINWFEFGPDRIGIPLDRDIWHTRSPAGQMQLPGDGYPLLLVGTFNKVMQYTSGVYAHLHCEFRRRLDQVRRLVICGYGFGDKGINTRIVEWLFASQKHRLVLVNPRGEDVRHSARFAIAKNWDTLAKRQQLSILARGAEQVTWQDIAAQLRA